MIIGLLALILTLLLVVGIHEAGHAIVARWFKVKIEHIAIGFGKPLVQWQSKKGIKWIWALWPLGGSVRLLNTRIAEVPEKQHPYCFDKQPMGVKILILSAGVVANIILAWLALLLVFNIGINQRPPVVEKITANSLADKAGFKTGDTITSVDGKTINSWQQFGQLVIIGMGHSKLNVTVKSVNGKQKQHLINLKDWQIKPRDASLLTSLGIFPDYKAKKQLVIADSFWDALKQATQTLAGLLFFFFVILERIVTGDLPFTLLLGPVGILEVTVNSFVQGVSVFVMFVANLSLTVAVINILPFPGLDGGSIIYACIEKIRGKPMSVAMEVLLYQLAVIGFVVLLINLMMNDLQRYLS